MLAWSKSIAFFKTHQRVSNKKFSNSSQNQKINKKIQTFMVQDRDKKARKA